MPPLIRQDGIRIDGEPRCPNNIEHVVGTRSCVTCSYSVYVDCNGDVILEPLNGERVALRNVGLGIHNIGKSMALVILDDEFFWRKIFRRDFAQSEAAGITTCESDDIDWIVEHTYPPR